MQAARFPPAIFSPNADESIPVAAGWSSGALEILRICVPVR
jgi:hypothetical protein